MKNLIIHPEDGSTVFLKKIYEGLTDKTAVTGGVDKEAIRELILRSDRVFMLGHGTPSGLISVGKFINAGTYIIDYSMVDALKKQDNNIYIWCDADCFVRARKLKGFFSGMFISEMAEALRFDIPDPTEEMIYNSNFEFSTLMSKYLDCDKRTLHANVVREYRKLAESNPVARYNVRRLYVR